MSILPPQVSDFVDMPLSEEQGSITRFFTGAHASSAAPSTPAAGSEPPHGDAEAHRVTKPARHQQPSITDMFKRAAATKGATADDAADRAQDPAVAAGSRSEAAPSASGGGACTAKGGAGPCSTEVIADQTGNVSQHQPPASAAAASDAGDVVCTSRQLQAAASSHPARTEAPVAPAQPYEKGPSVGQLGDDRKGQQSSYIRQQATLSGMLRRAAPTRHGTDLNKPQAADHISEEAATEPACGSDPAAQEASRRRHASEVGPDRVAQLQAECNSGDRETTQADSELAEAAIERPVRQHGEECPLQLPDQARDDRECQGEVSCTAQQEADCDLRGIDVEEQRRIMREIWLRQSVSRPPGEESGGSGGATDVQIAAHKRSRGPGNGTGGGGSEGKGKQMRISAMLKSPKNTCSTG